jgi:hexosaminidase
MIFLTIMGISTTLQGSGIVPMPVSQISGEGFFTLTNKTAFIYTFDGEHRENIHSVIDSHMSKFYGFKPTLPTYAKKFIKGSVWFNLDAKLNIPSEGYKLEVTKDGIKATASTPNGLFYAAQSLVQLMPADEVRSNSIDIQSTIIEDAPRFPWRGLHLDVCRHFMPKEFILRYIDYMSMHKLNTFHFHLTEDQGWRIEIKKYPKLTEIGSKRAETLIGRNFNPDAKFDGRPHGGFFTQEDIREIVNYAAKRYITVVPEIEMPGHALAALASYPELGCTGGPYEVAKRWGVFNDIMCAGKESTFEFLEGVIDEVIDLFPSKIIHIGGDEAPKHNWKECPLCQQRMKEEGLKDEHELQSWFITRMEKYINSKGRNIIGWDEILEGGLAPNAAVMSWRGEAGGIEAAKSGHYVVMSPGSHCYLDHYQAEPATQPLAIGGFTPLEKIYSYEPVPDSLTSEEAKYIMGAQGNVWTEYMPNSAHVEYMVYPRAAALSEVVWSPKESRNYESFMERMQSMIKRYYAYGINFSRVEFVKEK